MEWGRGVTVEWDRGVTVEWGRGEGLYLNNDALRNFIDECCKKCNIMCILVV